jgi:AraC-like DNA-binding protein
VSFRKLATDHIVTGALLAIVHRLFPRRIPTVSEYAKATGISSSTFSRAADWLWKRLPGLFRRRQPGRAPRQGERQEPPGRQEARTELAELRRWLAARLEEQWRERKRSGKKCPAEPTNDCHDGEAKKRIAETANRIRAAGFMTYEEVAAELGLNSRHLRRIREEVKEANGEAPEKQSTRPQEIKSLHRKIQILIGRIEMSASTKKPYGATDIKRILEKHYKEQLKEYHGETISADTVSKYMGQNPEAKAKEEPEHPRGSFVYPEPFQVVALDTSYFKLFGFTFYMITVLELCGRLNLITRIFLRENTEAVVTVIEEFLERYPGIQIAVIDRGTPYLNDEVRTLLESHGRHRLVCPPDTPTAKAPAERHFFTLKTAIRQAVETVFPEDPQWAPEQMAKALELAVAVFASLYHRIPQEGIDGKSPAERAVVFDPVRAAARQVALFQQALNDEPSDLYARHIHQYFQFPWEERETVGKLRQFSTAVLRKLLEEEKERLGPPLPTSIGEPLDYLVARAREIRNKRWAAFYVEQWHSVDAEERRKRQEKEEREERENPEAHVDGMLRALITSVRNGHGVAMTIRYMREVLGHLAAAMGRYFAREIERLKRLAGRLCDTPHIVAKVVTILDEVAAEAQPP